MTRQPCGCCSACFIDEAISSSSILYCTGYWRGNVCCFLFLHWLPHVSSTVFAFILTRVNPVAGTTGCWPLSARPRLCPSSLARPRGWRKDRARNTTPTRITKPTRSPPPSSCQALGTTMLWVASRAVFVVGVVLLSHFHTPFFIHREESVVSRNQPISPPTPPGYSFCRVLNQHCRSPSTFMEFVFTLRTLGLIILGDGNQKIIRSK